MNTKYGYTMRIAKTMMTALRLTLSEITSHSQRDYVSLPARLRLTISMLLMLFFGFNVSWGQTDYSGVYYIANNNQSNYIGYDNANNFYLCPAQEYYNNGNVSTESNDTPFLTTYKTGQANNALWIVEKVTAENYTNYYTFKQQIEGNRYRYITVNDELEGYKKHRRRVHLEEFTPSQLTDRNYFSIEQIASNEGVIGYSIGCLDKYKPSGTQNKYLNPPSGNQNSYTSFSNNESPQSGGIVGFFTKGTVTGDGRGSTWFFEVPKPVIHIDGNNRLSLTCVNENVTIHYTVDNGEPTATGTEDIYDASADIILTEGGHTIKAIAVMNNGNVGYASGLITQEVTVFSTEHPYLISNNQNPWTIGSETKNIFYLIPSDVSSGNTTVNTTSMPRPTMEWNIRYTGEADGELYLNIINAKTGDYLYRTGDKIYMKTSSEKTTLENEDDNGFKFYLIKRTDGYSIVPYGITNKYLNKNSGNTDKNAVNLSGTDNEYSQWNFVTKDAVLNDGILPFTSSDANTAVYYKIQNKIQNGNGDNYFIIPPTTTNYATASDATDDATVKKMSWCFVKVEDPNDDDWLTYYKVVNAETGKALHYTGTTNTNLNVGSYDDEDNNYKFAFVKSPTTDYYYIVPKAIKDDQLAQIPMIWRDNTALKKGATRGNSGNIWTFTQADIFCNDPVFEENDGSITISCVPDITRIYYTTDGTEPNPNDENQRYTNNTPFSASDQLLIKAIAFVSDGTNTASSSVITLLNKPDITLDTESYTYTGTECEPGVTKVSIEVSVGEIIAPTSPATYTVTYSNNVNAGTATVNIVDNPDDKYYIWGSTTFTINPAGVTLTANSGTKTYDGTEQTVNGFTSSVNELTFEGVSASGSGTNKGEYPVTFTGVTIGTTKDTSGNYVVTGTTDGMLTISPKQLTITADSETKVYDGTTLTKNSYTNTGIIASDHIESVTVTGSQTNAGASDNVPSAAVIKNSTDDDVTANYDITYTNGTLEVTKKPLTVTADAKSKAYGDADPTLTYTSEGLINDDAITGTLSREAGDDVGTYAITQGDLTAGNNYEIVFNSANLTITQVELTITANDRTITYGDAPAGNGVTYSGFIGTEDESVLSGTLDYDFSYTQYGDVGNAYTITPKGLTSNNYNITFTSGYLTVTAKTVGIDWTDTELTYNGNEQIPTATATGLVISDEIGVTVTGAQTNVGNYTATASALTGDKAGNYELPNDNTHSFTISGKSIGNDTTPADGFTFEFDEDGNIILKSGDHILTKDVDYSIGEEIIGEKYSTRNISGIGNYTGSLFVKNAIVSFTTDNNQYEWTSTFVAESSGIGHALPEGVSAYIISSIQGEWAIPEPLDYIPAGVPVLLVARETKNGFLVKDANPEEVTVITPAQEGANMLKEVTEATPDYDAVTQSAPFVTKQIYLLFKNEFVFNKSGNLKKGRVYLINPNYHPASSASAPARLMISWTIPTDVQSLPDGRTEIDKDEVWYTIDGRRLDRKPNAKGLYIVNGKKIVVK